MILCLLKMIHWWIKIGDDGSNVLQVSYIVGFLLMSFLLTFTFLVDSSLIVVVSVFVRKAIVSIVNLYSLEKLNQMFTLKVLV